MKRSRGRGGRRPQQNNNNNPNRTFDSSGPEIKIRGSAVHVYEKYLQLARDANSSGDRVMAENYLQHAEHYYRILAANQLQQQQYQQSQNGGQQANGQNTQNGQPNYQQGGGNGNGNGQNYGNQQPPVSNATFSLTDNGGDGNDDDGDEMGPE